MFNIFTKWKKQTLNVWHGQKPQNMTRKITTKHGTAEKVEAKMSTSRNCLHWVFTSHRRTHRHCFHDADKIIHTFSHTIISEKALSSEWACMVYRCTRHIIGHFGHDFIGQMTKPTVLKHWRELVGRQDQAWILPEPLHHVTLHKNQFQFQVKTQQN